MGILKLSIITPTSVNIYDFYVAYDEGLVSVACNLFWSSRKLWLLLASDRGALHLFQRLFKLRWKLYVTYFVDSATLKQISLA